MYFHPFVKGTARDIEFNVLYYAAAVLAAANCSKTANGKPAPRDPKTVMIARTEPVAVIALTIQLGAIIPALFKISITSMLK